MKDHQTGRSAGYGFITVRHLFLWFFSFQLRNWFWFILFQEFLRPITSDLQRICVILRCEKFNNNKLG